MTKRDRPRRRLKEAQPRAFATHGLLGGEEKKKDDANEAGSREVGELEAAILAQRANEKGEQRRTHAAKQ